MQFLPQEEPEIESSQSGRRGKHGVKSRPKRLPGRPELLKYRVALKAISRRIDRYADHELPEGGVLDLLEDTRAQVLSLHLARKQLQRRGQKKPGRKHLRHRYQ